MIFPYFISHDQSTSLSRPGRALPPWGPSGHGTEVRSDVDEKDPVLMSKRFREKLLRSKGAKAYLAVEV